MTHRQVLGAYRTPCDKDAVEARIMLFTNSLNHNGSRKTMFFMGKSHEEHVRRVRAVHGNRFKVVGRYVHSHIKVKYRCPKHGHWMAYANNVEKGTGCRKCSDLARRISSKEHAKDVEAVHGDRIRLVDPYVTMHIKIRYRCPEHGVFSAKPLNIIHNQSGCRRCYNATVGPRSRKSHVTYKKEARAYGVEVLETYRGAHERILHRCSAGHTWESKPNWILSGYGCPLCDRSQYRRRRIQVGNREVLVQGSEGRAADILLNAEGVKPHDLAFSKQEGLPTFRYRFDGRWRVYVPDIYRPSLHQVIEVKSGPTLGYYDPGIYRKVRAKARAVLREGYSFRLMVIHRNQLLDLGKSWHRLSWEKLIERFRRKAHAQDRRLRRKSST